MLQISKILITTMRANARHNFCKFIQKKAYEMDR